MFRASQTEGHLNKRPVTDAHGLFAPPPIPNRGEANTECPQIYDPVTTKSHLIDHPFSSELDFYIFILPVSFADTVKSWREALKMEQDLNAPISKGGKCIILDEFPCGPPVRKQKINQEKKSRSQPRT